MDNFWRKSSFSQAAGEKKCNTTKRTKAMVLYGGFCTIVAMIPMVENTMLLVAVGDHLILQ